MKHKKIIDKWPSKKTLAEDINKPLDTVLSWYKRESIPSKYWKDILRIAENRNIKLSFEDFIK